MSLTDFFNQLFMEAARRQGIEAEYWLRQNQWVFFVFAFVVTFFIILIGKRIYLLYFKKSRGKRK